MTPQDANSTRPYLIRALHEWCSDNGFTPHVAVKVDDSVQVPREYVNNGEIVLNIGLDATSALQLGNDFIEFKARFGGKPRDILVPVGRVIAIYARENGQGMAFPPPVDLLGRSVGGDQADLPQEPSVAEPKSLVQLVPEVAQTVSESAPEGPRPPPTGSAPRRPALKRVK
ncbi:MAG: ClpXP protease specificity-enhancing factor [Giesbergeria sp.]